MSLNSHGLLHLFDCSLPLYSWVAPTNFTEFFLLSIVIWFSDRSICLRSAKKDLSRTFHTMRLFQPGCPFHTRLHNLLAAFVMYQPRIGYLPGMSYLAAVLLLAVADVFDSFVLFANILDKPCHRAFYNPDESEVRSQLYWFSKLIGTIFQEFVVSFNVKFVLRLH